MGMRAAVSDVTRAKTSPKGLGWAPDEITDADADEAK
jgi:hypothetical protein